MSRATRPRGVLKLGWAANCTRNIDLRNFDAFDLRNDIYGHNYPISIPISLSDRSEIKLKNLVSGGNILVSCNSELLDYGVFS